MGPGGAVWGKKPSTKNLVGLSLSGSLQGGGKGSRCSLIRLIQYNGLGGCG